MGFTQAVCAPCWNERNPANHVIPGYTGGELETCCYCGNETLSGLYVRVDPTTVPYPQEVT